MKESLREWLSKVEPTKPPFYKGTLTTVNGTSDIEFNSSNLEFKIDGSSVAFSEEKSLVKNLNLNTLEQTPIRASLSKFFVHVNNFCNLRCTYCYEEDLPYDQIQERSLPDDKINEVCQFIQKQSEGSRGIQITFFGGEPLLSFPKLVQFHNALESTLGPKGFKSNIVTNGTILKKNYLEFLKEKNFDVMISFDGTREYQNSQRPGPDGVSTYDLVVTNIKRLISAGIQKVSIRITYGQESLDLLRSIKEVASLGVHDMSFRPIMDGTAVNEWNDLEQHARNLHGVVDYYLLQLVKREPIIINNVHEVVRRILLQIPKTNYCDWGRTVSITPDGDIYPCTHFVGMPDFKMGDTKDQEINQALRDNLIRATKLYNLPCNECSIKYLCGGGCRGCSHYVHSDIFREDDYCEARREIIYAVLTGVVKLWQDGRWQNSSNFIQSLMAGGGKKHSCDRFS